MGGVDVRRFRYAPDRLERLAYRGGLLAGARTPSGAPVVPALLAAFMTAARGAVAQLDPDVVHAHWWLPGGLAGAATIAGKHRHRFVITLHGTDVALLRNGALRRLARGVTGRANVVAAVSHHRDVYFSDAKKPVRCPVYQRDALKAGTRVAKLFGNPDCAR